MTVEEMRDHWWWRPGWAQGRSFYTWHVTFEDSAGAHDLVKYYTPLLDRFSTLDQVGVSGLHLTMQGLGFTDEVRRSDVDKIVAAVRHRVSNLSAFSVRIGPAHLDPETVQMPVQPLEGLASVRFAIRDAIGDVWGIENIPEDRDRFRPHVTLAYSNAAGPADVIDAALRDFPPLSVDVGVRKVSLIDLNRDAKRYEWTELAAVPIGV